MKHIKLFEQFVNESVNEEYIELPGLDEPAMDLVDANEGNKFLADELDLRRWLTDELGIKPFHIENHVFMHNGKSRKGELIAMWKNKKDHKDLKDYILSVIIPSSKTLSYVGFNESVSFGEFKKDALAWKAANFVYDKSRSGSRFADLFNFLASESNSDMTKSKLFTITRKLYRTGDFVIVDNPDWKRSVIYHKSYVKSIDDIGKINESGIIRIGNQISEDLKTFLTNTVIPRSRGYVKNERDAAALLLDIIKQRYNF